MRFIQVTYQGKKTIVPTSRIYSVHPHVVDALAKAVIIMSGRTALQETWVVEETYEEIKKALTENNGQ